MKRVAVGMLTGMVMGDLITVLTSGMTQLVAPDLLERAGSLPAAFLLQTFLSGLIGAVAFAGVGLYGTSTIPLMICTLVHFGIITVVFLPSAGFMGWYRTKEEAVILVLLMAAIHMLIFFIMNIWLKAEVKELNRLNETGKRSLKETTDYKEVTL